MLHRPRVLQVANRQWGKSNLANRIALIDIMHPVRLSDSDADILISGKFFVDQEYILNIIHIACKEPRGGCVVGEGHGQAGPHYTCD